RGAQHEGRHGRGPYTGCSRRVRLPDASVTHVVADVPVSNVAGIGLDLLRTDRVEKALARHGDRFVQRILGPQERARYVSRGQRSEVRGVRFLATRFAAKEAFSKAIGLGMRMPMYWRAVQILNEPSGRPLLVIS